MKRMDASQKSTLKRVLVLARPYRLRILGSLALAAVIVGTTLYLPVLSGRAIDDMIGAGRVDFAAIARILNTMSLVLLVTAACQWWMTQNNNVVAFSMVRDLRDEAFDKMQKLPLSYIDSHAHGDLISRIMNDADQFSEGLLMGLAQLFTGVLTILLTLGFMLAINAGTALIVIGVTPLSIFAAGFIAKRTYVHFKTQAKARAQMTDIAEEMIGGLEEIRMYDRTDAVAADFRKADEQLRQASVKATFYSSITNPSTRFVNNLVYAGVAVFGAMSAIQGKMSVGQLTVFLSYASQYTKPFNDISGVMTELQNSLACAARLFELLDETEIQPDDADAADMKKAEGRVELQDVFFSYRPDQPLIRDFNLKAEPGQNIAIVGPTGCGKTTLINLLMRFYDVDSGRILVEGADIRHCRRQSLRRLYGMVLQDTWIRHGTVLENIALGRKDASREEIIAAAVKARADGFIRRLKDGYDTVLPADGGSLSAGERQLLCIARVMLAVPDMLILDEATSSIDTRTEKLIQQAFDELMKGRTSFIVAHRLSTIRNADLILVMKDGQILERGRHQELLDQNGFYAQLYRSQFED